jgi:hypothetical protein
VNVVNQIAGFIADNDVIEAGWWDYQGQFSLVREPGGDGGAHQGFLIAVWSGG